MSIKTRLVKLESTMIAKTKPLKIARFFVAPGFDSIGYDCSDVTIIREPGESVEDLHKRCNDAVAWSEGNHRFMFQLLEDTVDQILP